MMRKAGGAALMLVVLVTTLSFCEDNQARGEAMLERARAAADIRARNGPAFRLKVTFSFISENLETLTGTYNEWWLSRTQWRREIVVADSRRIEIGGPDKLWLLETGPSLPEQVRRLPESLDPVPQKSRKFDFDSILDPAPRTQRHNVPSLRRARSSRVRSAFVPTVE